MVSQGHNKPEKEDSVSKNLNPASILHDRSHRVQILTNKGKKKGIAPEDNILVMVLVMLRNIRQQRQFW